MAAQLMEAQPTCSLGLGYEWHVGIPVVGKWTNSYWLTFRVPRSEPIGP